MSDTAMDQTTAAAPAPRAAGNAAVPFLEVRDIHKRFAGVHALKGVSLAIEPGRIYHLMGENGCGKSTLIKIISGAQPASSGEILIEGEDIGVMTPIAAQMYGIETVYQDLSLLPNLSVAENVALGQQLVSSKGNLARRLDRSRMWEVASEALQEIDLPHDPAFLKTIVSELPIATRQLVAIARAIATRARLVIMDEPTTALTRREVQNLFRIVERLRSQGISLIFVTHKLDECKEIGGQIVILRDGAKVMEGDIADYDKTALTYWMTGKTLEEQRYRQAAHGGENLMAVTGLGREGAFSDISFSVHRGEIFGITGLLDSGRNELALALSGVSPANRGRIELDGRDVTPGTPSDAIAAGIGYVPEDRLDEGLFLEKSIDSNIIVTVLDRLKAKFGFVDRSRRRELTSRMVEELQIATPNTANPVQSLSGGNQQRVLIARWLAIDPRLLVLHGPTVGVDVGSKDTIFRIIQRLAADGVGIVIISDDLPELLQNCDRIAVMRKGVLATTFDAETVGEDELYTAMMSDAPGRTGQ